MAKDNYGANDLSVLEGLDAVRKRPGMYIGSKDTRGFMHCIYEIVDNSVDEALAGHCSEILVEVINDNTFKVTDNGRGIPVDIEKSSKMSGVELVLTKLHAGGKFDDGNYNKVGGLHGVGSSVVNALSSKLVAQVKRNGKVYEMQFSKGKVGTFTGESFVPSSSKVHELQVIGNASKLETGTSIEFTLDREIFPESSTFVFEQLDKRLSDTAYLVPQLKIIYKDLRESTAPSVIPASPSGATQPEIAAATPRNDGQADNSSSSPSVIPAEAGIQTASVAGDNSPSFGRGGTNGDGVVKNKEYYSENGLTDFVEAISDSEPISDVWSINGKGTFEELTQNLGTDKQLKTSTSVREVDVDVSFRWVNNYECKIDSFVNIINTPFGGSHVDGFSSAIVKVVRKQVLENARKLKFNTKGEEKVEKDDIFAGLRAVISVKVPEPQFEGQTKETLGTAEVKPIVQRIVSEKLEYMFTTSKKEYRHSSQILEKIVSEMKARIGAKKQKEMLRKKSNVETAGSMPAKYVDSNSNDAEKTELFIVEGDSALGTAKLARNSEFQALLPIRGKILNVQKASLSQILANVECSAIIQVIGAGSKQSFDLAMSRFKKIVFMTDADVDGAHIRILLLTFFYNYLRPLIEDGRVYAAVPPLHRIELVRPPKDEDKYIYTYTEEELQVKLQKLDQQNVKYKDDIQRYKGLGEMDADQLANTTMDPNFRLLRRVDMKDAEEAANIFELLMGDEVAPRKDFIVENSDKIDRQLIDA
jgi:DNA gyrase subunit B